MYAHMIAPLFRRSSLRSFDKPGLRTQKGRRTQRAIQMQLHRRSASLNPNMLHFASPWTGGAYSFTRLVRLTLREPTVKSLLRVVATSGDHVRAHGYTKLRQWRNSRFRQWSRRIMSRLASAEHDAYQPSTCGS